MADPALQTPEEQSDALAGKGLQTVMRRALPASAVRHRQQRPGIDRIPAVRAVECR